MGAVGSSVAEVDASRSSGRSQPHAIPAWALAVAFPGLVTAMVVGNQGWTIGGIYIGQILSWLVDAAAVAILVAEFSGAWWPWALTGAIAAARLAGSGWNGSGWVDTSYTFLLNILFAIAGIVLARRAFGRVRRHVRWICGASLVFMMLQVVGAGEWTQFLATENEGRPKTAQPTLFVQMEDLQFQTVQARPSGLLHSNNFLSGIVLFALALNLADRKRRAVSRWDVALLLMAILSMAKIVFLGTALMLLWQLMAGTSPQRGRALRLFGLAFVYLAVYAFLFPGLFDSNLSTREVLHSVFIRVNDFVDRLSPTNPIVVWVAPYLEDTARLTQYDVGAGLSGYSHLIQYVPLMIGGALVVVPLYFLGWMRLFRHDPVACSASVLVGIFAVVYPAAVPLLAAQIFWFMAGFAALPIAMLVAPSLDEDAPHAR